MSNWFDFLLVAGQMLEMASTSLCELVADEGAPQGSGHARHVARQALMTLRGMRMIRVVRIMRVLHLVPHLRMLLISLVFSLKSLLWVIMLIFICILVFGLVLTQIVTNHKVAIGREAFEGQEALEEFFGTLDRTMLALYEVISEGMHWSELAKALMVNISPWLVYVMILYSAFSVFAMMNVLTAFFCDNISKAAEEDKQVLLLQDMWNQFKDLGGQQITEDVFMARVGQPYMARYLAELELTAEDIKDTHFFQLIDKDGSGGLDVDELMTGCMRLTNHAKFIDIAGLSYMFKLEQEAAAEHRAWIRLKLENLAAM